jgi:predicted TIM-barrel fold metal-dependent hydrolase
MEKPMINLKQQSGKIGVPLVDSWIDVHAHFHPPASQAESEAMLHSLHEACWCVDKVREWDVDDVLAYMDRTGIQMQMLSYIPKKLEALRAANSYGASIVKKHPSRFGLLMALPSDDPDVALAEIIRSDELEADGFAMTCRYNEVYLSDARLDPVWAELDRRGAAVFVHPDGYAPGKGRPAAVMEVAAETALTFTDMLYAAVFRRFPNIRFVVAHCGGALPALSGRLLLLGLENWVPNSEKLTHAEMKAHLRRLFLDTAGTMPTGLAPALEMTTPDHIVYGSDCGVPCSTDATMDMNLEALLAFRGLSSEEIEAIGHNALRLFPRAAERIRAEARV